MSQTLKQPRAIIAAAFSRDDTGESRVIPLLLSEDRQEMLKYKGGLLTVSMVKGLVIAPDKYTMDSLNPMASGPQSLCPQCGADLVEIEEAFFWQDRKYPAMACDVCLLLWLKKGDNHLDQPEQEQTEPGS